MKILHILKTEPDKTTKTLMQKLSEEEEVTLFNLYEEGADYDHLVELIFKHDKIVSWW